MGGDLRQSKAAAPSPSPSPTTSGSGRAGSAAGDIDGDGLDDLVLLGPKNCCLVLIQPPAVHGAYAAPQPIP